MSQLNSYYQQLLNAAGGDTRRLLEAFKQAGVPDSTFYRVRHGGQSLRLPTAQKVMNELHGSLHRDSTAA